MSGMADSVGVQVLRGATETRALEEHVGDAADLSSDLDNLLTVVKEMRKQGVGGEAELEELSIALSEAREWERESQQLPQAVICLTKLKWWRLIGSVMQRMRGDTKSDLEAEAVEEEGKDVLETWTGWYEEQGKKHSMTVTLYLTSSNKLCGYGSDVRGDATWEGEAVDGTNQVHLCKQLLSIPEYSTTFMGVKRFQDGKHVLEGTWSVHADQLRIPIRNPTGEFFLEKEAHCSSRKAALGQLWRGQWQVGLDTTHLEDMFVVLTTDNNRLFGYGTDSTASFTHTGTFWQEGSMVKMSSVKVYKGGSACGIQFWGDVFVSGESVVMEGKWVEVQGKLRGRYHFTAPNLWGKAPFGYVQVGTSGIGELESWTGWHTQARQKKEVRTHVFLVDSSRPCGYGEDSLGEWTWEGEFVGDDRMVLRKQYVNNPDQRTEYEGLRSSVEGEEMISGRWSFANKLALFEPSSNVHSFSLKKTSDGSETAYAQYWLGYRESNDGSCVCLDGGALVLTPAGRIFGFGSDAAGTFTFLGTHSVTQAHQLTVEMVKLYAPAAKSTSSIVQYSGRVHLQSWPGGSTVMEGSWVLGQGWSGSGPGCGCGGSGSFRFHSDQTEAGRFLLASSQPGPAKP